MSWAGIAGIYIPFTAEANVNVHQPPLLLLSSGAHEMAHYLGFAREDEANFIAYLACIHSKDPCIRYSGVMLALIHCGNQLYKTDPIAYQAVWEACYSPGMIRDLRGYNEYWDRYEGQVEAAVDQLNDGYLKHNPAGKRRKKLWDDGGSVAGLAAGGINPAHIRNAPLGPGNQGEGHDDTPGEKRICDPWGRKGGIPVTVFPLWLSKKWLAPLFRGVHSSLAPTGAARELCKETLATQGFLRI